jgi:hypothetical protein
VRVQNEPIHADSRFVTEKAAEQIHAMVLPFDQAMLSLDFTALAFDGTDKINYAYRLAGWDKGWNYSNGSRTANYSSMHEGSYVFLVRVSHADGTWGKEVELLVPDVVGVCVVYSLFCGGDRGVCLVCAGPGADAL